MKKFKKINMLLSIDYFKTLWFNVKAFDFKTAMLFPVILGYGIKAKIDGKIRICGKVRFGMVKLGLSGSNDLKYYEQNKSYFSVEDGGVLTFSDNNNIGRHFSILCRGEMILGRNFSCNDGCVFSCTKSIKIGDDVLFGGQITVRDSNGHEILYKQENMGNREEKNIVIGNHVWVCNKSDLLRGTNIENNTVIVYRSLCNKHYQANSLVAGCPAKVCRENILWKK